MCSNVNDSYHCSVVLLVCYARTVKPMHQATVAYTAFKLWFNLSAYLNVFEIAHYCHNLTPIILVLPQAATALQKSSLSQALKPLPLLRIYAQALTTPSLCTL